MWNNKHASLSPTAVATTKWRITLASWIVLGVFVMVWIIQDFLLYRAVPSIDLMIAQKIVIALLAIEVWLIIVSNIFQYLPQTSLLWTLLGPITLILGTPRSVLMCIISLGLTIASLVVCIQHLESPGLFRVFATATIVFAASFSYSSVLLQANTQLTIKSGNILLTPEAIIAACLLSPFSSIVYIRMNLAAALEYELAHSDMWFSEDTEIYTQGHVRGSVPVRLSSYYPHGSFV